jgi:membrane protein implicated in regulation of membrane protease activity
MIKQFNDFLAKHATIALGTMWAFYIFLIYSLLPLVMPKYMTTLMYWSNVIQLITLPLLAVGTTILGKNSEDRAKEDHKAIMEQLELIKKMHGEVKEIHKDVKENVEK